jgi:hypothetical protein
MRDMMRMSMSKRIMRRIAMRIVRLSFEGYDEYYELNVRFADRRNVIHSIFLKNFEEGFKVVISLFSGVDEVFGLVVRYKNGEDGFPYFINEGREEG